MKSVDLLGSKIAQCTMVAAAEMVRQQGLTVDVDALCAALRREALVASDTIMSDGKALLDAGQGGWLESLLKVECVEAAKRALAGMAS